jgi:hypothetical protein
VGYANITIPTSILNGPITNVTIVVGNKTIGYPEYQITNSTTGSYLYFTFTFGSPVTIQVILVPEFPNYLAFLFLTATVITAVGKIALLRTRHKQSKSKD